MAIFSKVGKINTNRKKIDINLFVTLLIDLIQIVNKYFEFLRFKLNSSLRFFFPLLTL